MNFYLYETSKQNTWVNISELPLLRNIKIKWHIKSSTLYANISKHLYKLQYASAVRMVLVHLLYTFRSIHVSLNLYKKCLWTKCKQRALSLEVTCDFRLYLKIGRTSVKPSWKHWIFTSNYRCLNTGGVPYNTVNGWNRPNVKAQCSLFTPSEWVTKQVYKQKQPVTRAYWNI